MLKRNRQPKRINQTVSANRRKRMLANNKKKVIWRNRAFMQQLV
ncbi:hypothetical protein [Vibrio paucivorans]|nr:hypothetical protein [Vibrio paucivorans]